jgi:hypothetical protein
MPTATEIRGALDTLERSRVATDALNVGDVVIVPTFSDAVTIIGYRDATVKEIGAGSNDQLRTITTSAGTFQCADAYRHYRATVPAAAVKRAQTPAANTLPEILPTASHVALYASWRAFKAGTGHPYTPDPSACVTQLPRASNKKRPGDKLRRSAPDVAAWLKDAFYAGHIYAASVDDDCQAWIIKERQCSEWERYTTDAVRENARFLLKGRLSAVA